MRPRVPVLLLTLLSALLLGLLTGCGGDDPEPASGPGLPSQADLKSYFEAITSGDADQLADAQSEIAAAGSPAQEYAAYVAEAAVATTAAGQESETADVEEVDGGFKACIGPDQCATWTGLEGKSGRLTDFTINGNTLDSSLVDLSGQPPVESSGLYRVQPDYAYRLPSGTLNVLVTVTASDTALTPKPGTYIEQDQILKGDPARGPATIEAGASSPVVLPFPDAKDAKLDGQVTFDLGIQGVGSESIGFGLADPTA